MTQSQKPKRLRDDIRFPIKAKLIDAVLPQSISGLVVDSNGTLSDSPYFRADFVYSARFSAPIEEDSGVITAEVLRSSNIDPLQVAIM